MFAFSFSRTRSRYPEVSSCRAMCGFVGETYLRRQPRCERCSLRSSRQLLDRDVSHLVLREQSYNSPLISLGGSTKPSGGLLVSSIIGVFPFDSMAGDEDMKRCRSFPGLIDVADYARLWR